MSLNILIVDDSNVMRKIVLKSIKISGIHVAEVYEASNGQEAIELMCKKKVDLVMADINMPVMNGEEMIDAMKDNPVMNKIPVIVISTEGSEQRIERLLNKGAIFLHKPFSPEMFKDTIQKIKGIGA